MVLLCAAVAGGCKEGGPETGAEPAHLIRVGETEIFAEEFNRAFELAMTAYPYDIVRQPRAFREAQEQVLQELVERAVLAARAAELGIRVTPAELADAVARIKKGYPEGAFEQALLESAVSYEAWEAALRRRLLMEKVVARELENRAGVTEAEIREYYRAHYVKEGKAPAVLHPDIKKAIAQTLKADKLEAAYGAWLEKLKEAYPIAINQAEWRRILAESVPEGGRLGPGATPENGETEKGPTRETKPIKEKRSNG